MPMDSSRHRYESSSNALDQLAEGKDGQEREVDSAVLARLSTLSFKQRNPKRNFNGKSSLEVVEGGRFLQAYRKLKQRIICVEGGPEERCEVSNELVGSDAENSRKTQRTAKERQQKMPTPLSMRCGPALGTWNKHAFAYVAARGESIDIAMELAAALSQFEPVTVCVEGMEELMRARRSLPDHIRVVNISGAPERWTELPPVAFCHGQSGDTKLLEFANDVDLSGEKPKSKQSNDSGDDDDNDDEPNIDESDLSVYAQIAEIERFQRFLGKRLPSQRLLPVLDCSGAHTAILEPKVAAKAATDGVFAGFADGFQEIVIGAKVRLVENGIAVARGVPKALVDTLASKIDGQVWRIDERYIGFYVGNSGILLAKYGQEENDLKALKILQHMYPKRRVVQIQVPTPPAGETSPTLNLNEYVLGFPGAVERKLPDRILERARVARERLNLHHVEKLKLLNANLSSARSKKHGVSSSVSSTSSARSNSSKYNDRNVTQEAAHDSGTFSHQQESSLNSSRPPSSRMDSDGFASGRSGSAGKRSAAANQSDADEFDAGCTDEANESIQDIQDTKAPANFGNAASDSSANDEKIRDSNPGDEIAKVEASEPLLVLANIDEAEKANFTFSAPPPGNERGLKAIIGRLSTVGGARVTALRRDSKFLKK